MGKRVYIGNLSYQTNSKDFEAEIRSVGVNPISLKVIEDRATGQSKGFAFAEFNTDDEARQAIEVLDGHVSQGRTLRVDMAIDKPRTGSPGGGGGARPQARAPMEADVWAENEGGGKGRRSRR